jgi:glycine/D-amino acid oxidase-like deaminating enzyme
MNENNTIIICGAGIAGVATAYYLLKENKNIKVVLIDKNQPLSFTTSKSGENFRDYWPQKNMRLFVNDSILLMKELREKYGADSFDMVYSGYNFISHDLENSIFGTDNQESSNDDIEELTNTNFIQNEHPYLDKKIKKILKIKNAGKIDVYALGSLLLREAKKRGLIQLEAEVLDIEKNDLKFTVILDTKKSIDADKVVIAAGPFINNFAKMFDFQFPITNTLQRKFTIPDPNNIIPKDMPFTIYADSQYLDWSKEETSFFCI